MNALKQHAPNRATEVPASTAGTAHGGRILPVGDYPGDGSLSSGAFSPEDAARDVEWMERDQEPWPNQSAAHSIVAVIENVALPALLIACVMGFAILIAKNHEKIAACIEGAC